MPTDLIVTVALSVALAAWVTDHVALSVGLLRRKPRWRGVVALIVAPLAPVFGFGARLRLRSALWIVLAIAYVALRLRAYA
ncbi:MAG: hypothetical protein HYV09_10330 [Deltaproteobacteria bacterium]|nr:hypothetical protein [Deltaproteobacteria bacterium]